MRRNRCRAHTELLSSTLLDGFKYAQVSVDGRASLLTDRALQSNIRVISLDLRVFNTTRETRFEAVLPYIK